MEVEARAQFLRGISIFEGLPPESVARIAERAQPRDLVAGEWLFREGDPADALYVLRSGRIEILQESGGREAVIRAVPSGGVLGELALLTGERRSASVRARRDSALLQVSREAFMELLEGDPLFATSLSRTLAGQFARTRVAATPREPVPPVVAAATLCEHEAGASFTQALAAELADVGLLTLEDSGTGDGYAELLDQAERAHGQVLLHVEPGRGEEWDSFCLRQADRVLAVVDGGAAPVAGLGGADLAVLGSADVRRWATALQPRAVHLVDGDESVARLARRLSGRSPGVVLSGGGARGMAHVGVLRELLDAGAVIDRLGGCSMGALVAALFATGLSPEEIEERLREEFVKRNPIGDYTLPLAALVRGRRAQSMLVRLFGDQRIEELPREFFCVSSDLVSSELVVHRRGVLGEAVGASICLPGIAPPRSQEDRLLVDGGVLNNLPVETMAGRGEGPVIAVDVSARYQAPARKAGGVRRPRLERLSSWARRAVIGWDAALPTFTETLMRSVVLGSIDTAEAAQRHADLVIAPSVQGIGLTEWERLDTLRAQGAEAARRVLSSTAAEVLEPLGIRAG